MAFRYFPGWTQAQLEAAMAKVLEEQASGSTVASGGAGNVTASRNIQIDIDERRNRFYHDLSILDPDTYPPGDAMQDRSHISLGTAS